MPHVLRVFYEETPVIMSYENVNITNRRPLAIIPIRKKSSESKCVAEQIACSLICQLDIRNAGIIKWKMFKSCCWRARWPKDRSVTAEKESCPANCVLPTKSGHNSGLSLSLYFSLYLGLVIGDARNCGGVYFAKPASFTIRKSECERAINLYIFLVDFVRATARILIDLSHFRVSAACVSHELFFSLSLFACFPRSIWSIARRRADIFPREILFDLFLHSFLFG